MPKCPVCEEEAKPVIEGIEDAFHCGATRLLEEINADDDSTDEFKGTYTRQKGEALKAASFDRIALGSRGMDYERLDQLTVDLLLGVR